MDEQPKVPFAIVVSDKMYILDLADLDITTLLLALVHFTIGFERIATGIEEKRHGAWSLDDEAVDAADLVRRGIRDLVKHAQETTDVARILELRRE